jgi:hypothetical protein
MSNLPLRFGTGKSVQLHDNGLRAGSLIEQSIANLTREQAQNLMVEAGKARLDLKKKRCNRIWIMKREVRILNFI